MSRPQTDLLVLIKNLEEKKINDISLKESIDTSSAMGRFLFSVIGAISQMEIELKKERTEVGRKPLMARGKSGGRPTTDPLKLGQTKILYENTNKSSNEICSSLRISRRAFFYHLKESNKEVAEL